MVIGERFAWGHLEKTGGDATMELFLAVPELIRFADPPSSEEKHTAFPRRADEVRGKVLALNLRRLPSWVLSRALHRARYGEYPDYEPLPMMSPQEMAESTYADQRLLEFTGNQTLTIDRWLRTEFLADDFLAFVSEFTDIAEETRRDIARLGTTRLGTPLAYDPQVERWFTAAQIEELYARNPVWAAVERELYGEGVPSIAPVAPAPVPPAARPPEPLTQRERLARGAERALQERARLGDAWDEHLSPLDEASHARQVEMLAPLRYGNVLEIGCGPGHFTRRLADIADHVVAIDVAPLAIAQARTRGLDPARVELRVENVMHTDVRAGGPWDLIVLGELIYELGWLYPLFDIGWLAAELFAATRDGGRLLMANTYGREGEDVVSTWLIDTCRDLFLNVGYEREREERVLGTRDGIEYETLVTLYTKGR